MYALELKDRWASTARPSTSSKYQHTSGDIPWVSLLLGAMLVIIVVMAILTLLGPSIGNSFFTDDIPRSIGGSYGSQDDQPSQPAHRPSSTLVPSGGYPPEHMIIKNWELDLLEVLTWVVLVPGPYLVTLALIVWLVRSIQRHRRRPSGRG